VLVAVNFGDAVATVSYQGLQRPGGCTDAFSKAVIELPPAGKLAFSAASISAIVVSTRRKE
jgi:hypothetical protein